MRRFTSILLASLSVSSMGISSLCAQGFGSAPQHHSVSPHRNTAQAGKAGTPLDVETALNMITIEGTAVTRVTPQEIRLVLAVISEATSSELCQKNNAEQIAKVRKSWIELGIAEEKIVEDFISVLPTFSWHREKRDEHEVLLQKRSGFRMQSNLHLAVATEAEAMSAIKAAFANGVSDIVTFDYWSPDLEEEQNKARAAAVAAAKKKADILLMAFEERPPLINIQEDTQTFLPHTLYRTFQNVLEETVSYPHRWRDLPQIRSYRPKMTFFDGLKIDADVQPAKVALKPMIEVSSTVRLYYQSPATKVPAAVAK